MRRLRSSLVIAGVALAAIRASAAAEPLDIKEALKPRSFYSMQISPDGTRVVAIASANGGTGLVLIDTATSKAQLVRGETLDKVRPLAARWVTDDLIAVDTQYYAAIFKPSGEYVRRIGGRYLGRVARDTAGHDRVLATRLGSTAWIDRVDVETGEKTVTNFNMPGDPIKWIFDGSGNARVVSTMSTAFWSDDTTITHWYRASADADWEKLATFPVTAEYWTPMYLTRDGKSLAVSSRQDRDTLAYFRYDLGLRRVEEMMAGHPTQDIYAHRSENDENYDLVVTEGMKPEIEWLDTRWSEIQQGLDKAVPGRINLVVGRTPDRALVYSHGDVDPGRWFLLDTTRMTLREIAAAKPGIDPGKMRPTQVVSYAAADGLTIPAYLTLPADGARDAPAVVVVHGGPIARDRWQWDPTVQLLASRGYVVLQPQFRGSQGFGKRFEVAGYGQWGLAMQDDITAGVRWLVDRGYADARRICIFGGSYGGYAALWGLAKTPDLYRCGVSLAGVSDIEHMLKDDSDVNAKAVGRMLRRATIGELDNSGKQRFDDVSPLKNVARIKVPVLIAHGSRDARVPISHGERMVAALKQNGKDYEWLELDGEGHSLAREQNQLRFYQALFAFLERNLGKAPPDAGAAAPVEGPAPGPLRN